MAFPFRQHRGFSCCTALHPFLLLSCVSIQEHNSLGMRAGGGRAQMASLKSTEKLKVPPLLSYGLLPAAGSPSHWLCPALPQLCEKMQWQEFPEALGFHCAHESQAAFSRWRTVACQKAQPAIAFRLKGHSAAWRDSLKWLLEVSVSKFWSVKVFFCPFLKEGICITLSPEPPWFPSWACDSAQPPKTRRHRSGNYITEFFQGKTECGKRWPWRQFSLSPWSLLIKQM